MYDQQHVLAKLEKENEELKKALQIRTEDLTAAITQSTEAKQKLEYDNDLLRHRLDTIENIDVYEELNAYRVRCAELDMQAEYAAGAWLLQQQLIRRRTITSYEALMQWKKAVSSTSTSRDNGDEIDPYTLHFGAPSSGPNSENPRRTSSAQEQGDKNEAHTLELENQVKELRALVAKGEAEAATYTAFKETMEKNIKSLEGSLEAAQTAHSATVDQYERRLASAKDEAEENLRCLEEEHGCALEQARKGHQSAIEHYHEDQKSQYENHISDLRRDLAEMKADLTKAVGTREELEKHLGSTRASMQTVKANESKLQKDLAEARAETEKIVRTESSNRKQKDDEIAGLKSKYRDLLEQSASETAAIRERSAQEISRLRDDHQIALQELKNIHSNEWETARGEHSGKMIKMQQRLTETTKALEIARSEGAQRSGRTSDSGQSADMESISSTLVPQVNGGQLIFVEEIGEDAAPELSSACPNYRSIDVAHSEVEKAVSALVRDLRSLKQGLERLPGALNGHHISPPAPF